MKKAAAEAEKRLLREVRDYLKRNREHMREFEGNFFYGFTEDILEVFSEGGRFEVRDE